MLGNCTFEKEEKRAPKATYTFEYFKFLQTLNHIKIETINIKDDGTINKEKRELTSEEKEKLKELVFSKVTVTYSDVRKTLQLEPNQRFNMFTYRDLLNYTEETNKEIEKEKKLKEFESYKKIKTALNHIEKNYITKLTTD